MKCEEVSGYKSTVSLRLISVSECFLFEGTPWFRTDVYPSDGSIYAVALNDGLARHFSATEQVLPLVAKLTWLVDSAGARQTKPKETE